MLPTPDESPFFPKNNEPPKEEEKDLIWEEKLKRMAKGESPTRPILTEEEKKRLARLVELDQLGKMKKAGIDDPTKLPGEIDGP